MQDWTVVSLRSEVQEWAVARLVVGRLVWRSSRPQLVATGEHRFVWKDYS